MARYRSDDPCAFVDGITAMTMKYGGFAFARPACETNDGQCNDAQTGMTLRDYFAAEAMKEHMRALSNADLGSPREWNVRISEMAYLTADAMLQAREQ